MAKIKLIDKKLDQIKEYENNPRSNDKAVSAVLSSVEKFGYINPIIINADGVVLAGHTRLKALREKGETKVQVIRLSHLSDQQEKAFRIADNRVADYASWDGDLLEAEMEEIGADDWEKFGFKFREIKPERGTCTCPKCGKQFKK